MQIRTRFKIDYKPGDEMECFFCGLTPIKAHQQGLYVPKLDDYGWQSCHCTDGQSRSVTEFLTQQQIDEDRNVDQVRRLARECHREDTSGRLNRNAPRKNESTGRAKPLPSKAIRPEQEHPGFPTAEEVKIESDLEHRLELRLPKAIVNQLKDWCLGNGSDQSKAFRYILCLELDLVSIKKQKRIKGDKARINIMVTNQCLHKLRTRAKSSQTSISQVCQQVLMRFFS